MADLGICSRNKLGSVNKFLETKQCKPNEIFRRISAMYAEVCFSQKNVYKWAKLFKEGRKNVFDKDRPARYTRVRISIMIKSLDDTIQSHRKVKVEDIAHNLNIYVGRAHKVVYKDLGYKIFGCWKPKMLT